MVNIETEKDFEVGKRINNYAHKYSRKCLSCPWEVWSEKFNKFDEGGNCQNIRERNLM